MARIKINFPTDFVYQTEIPVRITDINYGGHMGNNVYLEIMQEARIRFLKSHGLSEVDSAGASIILGDAAVVYKMEVFYGDTLIVKIAADDFSRMSCDLKYQVLNKATGKEVARGKTAVVFFDYKTRSIVDMPEKFKEIFINSLNEDY